MSETKTVYVEAWANWRNSRVDLKAGDKVTIDATGQWRANPENGYGMTDADGQKELPGKDSYVLPDEPEAVLVGYVGDAPPSGAAPDNAFVVGKHLEFSGRPGTLWFIINDDMTNKYGKGYEDNQGTLTVTITIERSN